MENQQERATPDDRLEANMRFAAGGFVAGAIVGAVVAYFLIRKAPRADRPPIIVKGGSLIIENDPTNGHVGWREEGSDWVPDQEDGNDVHYLRVELLAGSSKCDFPIDRAEKLEITYRRDGREKKFKIKAHDKKPKVGKESGLEPRGHQLIYDESKGGEIVHLKADGEACPLSGGARLRITFL